MQERNIIGGFTAAVLAPFVEGWQRIIWFLLLAVILILGDFNTTGRGTKRMSSNTP